MQELVVATKNKGKLREIKGLLKGLDLSITSLADYPSAPQIDEDGLTFAQNALKKAATLALYTRKLTLGEDSGLEVEALGHGPGINSARFSGENATDRKNNLKLMRCLRNVPLSRRQARYRCFAALVDKDGIVDTASGQCQGIITKRARGKNGFGYDPYFLIKRYGKTFGELDPAVKAKISHRARALRKIKKILRGYLKQHNPANKSHRL
ncbi:MAG: RdgB/HAM1 family non-canonical purine NTP pyrophosphatase [Candidatus Omnitrophica bacterium]|nr:RdgB/HAM1 family non-canonical purine NTP pyrophosphatase [Candidatus Omnitrophota bacterium]